VLGIIVLAIAGPKLVRVVGDAFKSPVEELRASRGRQAEPMAQNQEPGLPWLPGPIRGALGAEAEVSVPAGCGFLGSDQVGRFMEATENPASGLERGVVLCTLARGSDYWFVVFSFDPSGYVRDDERGSLDSDAILAALRRGTAEGNRLRAQRGWVPLTLDGWQRTPFYDVNTNNLTWATIGRADTARMVNHSVRLLGRRGVMHADLVVSPQGYGEAVGLFASLLGGFSYSQGNRYAEWHAGDRVAAYGLTALIAGGAGAIAVKTGLLAKFWKLIVAGAVALAAGVKSLFGRGKRASTDAA
jgi:uncharacterized membrane-anchored protein